jgi:hypothetical protein
MRPEGLFMGTALSRGRRIVTTSNACAGLALLTLAISMGLGSRTGQADVIMLRGGGQVEGRVQPDPQNEGKVLVWLLKGRKPVSFQKAQIVEVIPKASPLDDYFEKTKKAPQTVQAQYDLGAWCEQNKLTDLAKVHYEAALAVDKTFEPAHRKLGHVFHDGYWLSRDDLSAVQGLVKYKGRWVSTEEKAKRMAEEEVTATHASWLRRIKILRQAIVNGPGDRRREAESQLMAIRDVDAIKALVRVLGNDEPPQRILLAQILAAIAGKEATAALVRQVLAEPTSEVRAVILDKLKDRDDPAVVTQLTRSLASGDIQVINRAAWVLGNLGAVQVVPKLIPVLLSYEQQIVMVSKNGGVQPAIGIGGMPVAPLAFNNNDIAVLTPPTVSAGAVAYGVMSLPAFALPYGFTMNVGAQIDNRPEPRVVTFTYRNVEVLAALEKMTGQDFGYDVESWRHWVSREFNPTPKPARQVAQPEPR